MHRTVDESVRHGARLLRNDVRIVDRGGGVFQHGDWAPSGVTDQFLSDAGTYHDRYFNRLDFLGLAGQCLIAAAIDCASPIRVLDIGSGGGSSVFALAKLLPNAEVVASDISPQLLHTLVAFAATQPALGSRISAYCFDLHQPFFRENTFDLIFG
ncbi:MAG: methyltransferase domain-containing protein, partial [Casimicrobiaceae bacterium]